jgi:hypothetical protein
MAYTTARRIRRSEIIIAEILRLIAAAFFAVCCGLVFAWVGINAVTGCGEVTRTIDGTYIKGECVLVPWVDANTYDYFIE